MSMEESAPLKGVFHVIATPIGNLADISARARATLAEVDCLYAEDTRHTGQLCRRLGLNPKLRSLHDHNEDDRVSEVIAQLQKGESVGLVSDAGTPLISDPGYRIVAACHAAGLQVSPVPGASALLAALSVCGLPTDRFSFRGFLPSKTSARKIVLESIRVNPETTIFFESRHRIVDSLADMIEVLGADRQICIARELTKAFETVLLDTVESVFEHTRINQDWQKGEFVLVVSGSVQLAASFSLSVQALLLDLATELPPKKAVAIVARNTGIDKKILYDWLVSQKNTGGK